MTDLVHAKEALLLGLQSPKVEALVEAMHLAAFADGEFAALERIQFSASLAALTDETWHPGAIRALVDQLATRAETQGRPARLTSLAARLETPEDRETALILAAAITVSDGEVASTEDDLLTELAAALQIPADRAAELVASVHRR